MQPRPRCVLVYRKPRTNRRLALLQVWPRKPVKSTFFAGPHMGPKSKLEALGIASVPRWFYSFGRPVSILASISTRSRSPGQPAWRTCAESPSKTWPICRVQWPAAPSRIKGHINRSLPGFGPSTRGNDEMMVAWGEIRGGFIEISSRYHLISQ